MELIPAVDILDGKCVRLTQGDYDRVTTYDGSPLELASQFRDAGAEWIHIVDLGAARSGHRSDFALIGQIAALGLKVEVGGGVRSIDIARSLREAGAARIVAGTALAGSEEFRRSFFELPGAVAGIDARDGEVRVAGWTEGAGIEALGFLQTIASEGCRTAVLTDIARDGMLTGPNTAFLTAALGLGVIDIVHSGGIASIGDVECLESIAETHPNGSRLVGAITGKAIYDGRLDLREAFASLGGRPAKITRD